VPVRTIPETICYNDHLIRVRVDPRVLDWRYACLAANAPQSREYIEAAAITTAGQLTVNQGMIENLAFPIPPLPEQHRILAKFDALQTVVSELKRLQTDTALGLNALLPAILDRAFKGELV
jgi:type I restriction enzyme S subunit